MGAGAVLGLGYINATNGFRLDDAGAPDLTIHSTAAMGRANRDGRDDLLTGLACADKGEFPHADHSAVVTSRPTSSRPIASRRCTSRLLKKPLSSPCDYSSFTQRLRSVFVNKCVFQQPDRQARSLIAAARRPTEQSPLRTSGSPLACSLMGSGSTALRLRSLHTSGKIHQATSARRVPYGRLQCLTPILQS